MARTASRLALFGALTASILGYLFYAPNLGDMEQATRIRALGATMKLTQIIVCLRALYFNDEFLFCLGYSYRNIGPRQSSDSHTRTWRYFEAYQR